MKTIRKITNAALREAGQFAMIMSIVATGYTIHRARFLAGPSGPGHDSSVVKTSTDPIVDWAKVEDFYGKKWKWVARDADGKWFLYLRKPVMRELDGVWFDPPPAPILAGHMYISQPEGIVRVRQDIDWKESLVGKPELTK